MLQIKLHKKLLSNRGDEIDPLSLLVFSICPVPEWMIFLEEKGGLIRNYEVTIIIDCSKSCLNNFSINHTYLTVRNLFNLIELVWMFHHLI